LTAGCTLNVSEGGALLICSEDLPIGTEMQVTNLRSDEFFTCRVVRLAGFHESGRFGLGVEILDPDREAADTLAAAEHSRTTSGDSLTSVHRWAATKPGSRRADVTRLSCGGGGRPACRRAGRGSPSGPP
jgi:hypothetical protein